MFVLYLWALVWLFCDCPALDVAHANGWFIAFAVCLCIAWLDVITD